MAEGGEIQDFLYDNECESDDSLFDSESEDLSEDGEDTDENEIPLSEDGEETEDEDDKRLRELESAILDEESVEPSRINDEFYGHEVRPIHLNILTDFVDAEIFLIDGDSLLLELLGEKTLDWNNGGQFLHLTYLLERFLQHFTDKGGVFHIVFFKDMEIIWTSQPSMLLARQALIMHLQYNTRFTVVTSIDNYWGKKWKDYVDDKIPAFLLLTDAENIPWKTKNKKREAVEFFFRSLLCHSLGQGLNCVFISGIEMTATKVMGFYTESSSVHKFFFRKVEKPVRKTWHSLMTSCRDEATSLHDLGCPGTSPICQVDLKEKVQTAFQSSPQGDCRKLATLLTCERMLCNFLNDPNITKETVKATEDRVKLFLLHSILLNKLPLKYRAHAVNDNMLDHFSKDGQVYPFNEIHRSLWEILKTIQDEYPTMTAAGHSLNMTSVADLMDGRLVHTLLLLALEQKSMELQAFSLPEDVIKEAEAAWSKVVVAVNVDALKPQFFPLFAENVTDCRGLDGSLHLDSSVKVKRLLDVGNVLVNKYAGEIRSKINEMAEDDSEEEIFDIGREFDELYHWHTLKPLTDDYDRTKGAKETITEKPPDDPKKRYWFYREKQTYVRFLRFYGNSLEGGIDRAKVITVIETGANKKKGKDKTGKVSKKQAQYIEDNKQRRKDEEMKKEQDKWSNTVKIIEPYLKRRNYGAALELIDEIVTNSKFPQAHLPALMVKVKCCFDAWQDKRYDDPSTQDMKYPVLLMEASQKLVQEQEKEEKGSQLTDKEKKKLAGYMQKLGFENIAATFSDLNTRNKEQADQFFVHQTSARFQLDHMGHLLKRDDRSDRDKRVDHFIPDTWQRELLDAVDNNESAVVVAPTSSGKTYASYYCMEKVLRESNDGVVVYVSPTKALVNQVAATIYARFHRKQLAEGRAVYGIFTRDYRHNTLNSQILVTVPQCLEILFLSPRRQDWTKNVKYVIFDEVHCLGQEIGAEVWEHLLLLIRCPFLALSATIGNPHDLKDWLQAAQNFREQQDKQENLSTLRKSYRVNLVTCEERYSDLEKSIYLPSPSNGGFSKKTKKYENGYDVTRTDEFVRLHPCAQLVTKQLKENGFPGDMSLTPNETLQLYDVMLQHWPDKESLQKLSPEQYFLEQSFIPKSNARQYEKQLKKEFKSWADDDTQLAKVEAIIQSLNSAFTERKASIDKEWNQLGMPSSGKEFNRKNFPKLIEQLKAQGKLPALVFSFDRVECENMAIGLATEFAKRERRIREQDNPRNEKLAKDRKQREQAQKLLKRQRDVIEKMKKGDRYHGLVERVAVQEVKGKDFAIRRNQPLPECTLAFTHGIGNEQLKKITDRIRMVPGKWKRRQTMLFKGALKRGISYHHAGLDSKKRSCVEMLFREKYLQVVTATGTLALGIHMPCKTVVLAGDSPFLNSLQYRQMSGRAGRRGFDPVGNVVFFGVPYRKVQRLITANIPKLVGNFPINVSLVLRLLLLTSKGDDKDDALTKALALLSHPFICRKHPEIENQIQKHFLFSVELLARLGLINKDNGAPQEMAGLATHLHYHEPSNFVLVSFLQRSLFHKLCKRQKNGKFSEDVMRTMVLVLNHLFARRFLHGNFVRRIDKCPSSKVILEDLPHDFAEALQDYNDQVTSVFGQYLTTVAAELEKDQGEENKLPLSGIEFPNQASIEGVDEHSTIQNLGRLSVPYSACSSFAALSGNSDLELSSTGQKVAAAAQGLEERKAAGDGELNNEDGRRGRKKTKRRKKGNENKNERAKRQSIDHLLKIVRQDVYTDMNVVPILPLKKKTSSGHVRRLNAYALDFYKHGSSAAIVKENEIKAGEVFVVLKDFCLTIKSISCSLEEWGPAHDNVVLAFKQLAGEFTAKFKRQFGADI